VSRTRRGRSLPSLRTRLFLSGLLIVALSVGVTFAVGLVLTRRSVEHANLDDLAHQADLLARREQGALYAFSNVASLKPFLAKQHERLDVFRLGAPPDYLSADAAAEIRASKPARGSVTVDGRRYLFAARRTQTKGFALLRPASLEAAGWGTYLRALAVAGAIGAALAALAAFFTARAVTRPVRRVAQASRSLAEGVSPEPVPVGGSAELASLATSFNDMARELQKAKEAERTFLLSVSHELKTPLTAIRGYAEGLEEGAFSAAEAAQTIREDARRLERLVRDLLDLARMNRREFAVHRERIDLGDVAREAVRRYEQEALACGVELEAVTDGPAPAEADPDRALQVVSNLVENALRSTPAGGSVRVRAEPGLLAVEDTGRGLPPEELPRAFERFYLYDRTPAARRIGTGLGLAIVKELSERMGGTVTVRSAPGQGTTFVVRLPATGAAGDASRARSAAPGTSR
jgi:two-component system OmpR family sensor kinase